MSVSIPVTDWLFLNDCSFPHVVAMTTNDALEAHEQGKNVVIFNVNIAHKVLRQTGLSDTMVRQRITWASSQLALSESPAYN